MRRLLSAAATASLLLAPTPLLAEDKAEQLDVMSISLSDVVKPSFGLQSETQGAGTPNQAGIGGFLPLKINNNSVWFVDALANVNFADFNTANSSVAGTVLDAFTVSTSTRLGYRWLTSDRNWMLGINAGYDSRPLKSGNTVSGYKVYDRQTPFFQQVAVSAEAIHGKWSANAYALLPIGEYGLGSNNVANLNTLAGASPLTTFGLKLAYAINKNWTLGASYYYEFDEKNDPVYHYSVQNSGVQASLSYSINNQLEAAALYSYDDYFESRLSGSLTWRFNSGKSNSESSRNLVLAGLSSKPGNRNVRVANSERRCRVSRRMGVWKYPLDTKYPYYYSEALAVKVPYRSSMSPMDMANRIRRLTLGPPEFAGVSLGPPEFAGINASNPCVSLGPPEFAGV